ncbi:MAG TPA: Rieske 2Fe-2S domain-containing protein [Nocardioidaceae bacterium]|nr:Rieske 2Fe-2S domain-containing protein [Nocardioidaceae bacterium]
MEYVRVCRSGQVSDDMVRRFFADGVEVAVSRWEGDVYITSNYCTHLDCMLSSGKVTEDGLLCSCHGSVFDFETGEPISPPATKPIRMYPSKEENGEIFVGLEVDAAANEGPRRRKQFEAEQR